MTAPIYSVSKIGKVIMVKHRGHWTLAKDIEFLNKLNDAFISMRLQSFVVFVDMRGWIVPDSVKTTNLKTALTMDRRSQRAECWLTDDLTMTDYLLHYFENRSFKLNRLTNEAEAKAWVMAYMANEKDKKSVEEWFSDQE
jgi:hypothetical protein